MFDLYAKSKLPFLTVIRLWDNDIGNILCSKYDPICIGSGEVGIDEESCSDISVLTTGKENKKRKAALLESTDVLKDVIKSLKDICEDQKTTPKIDNTQNARQNTSNTIEEMSLQELFETSDQIKRQIKFVEDMNALKDDEREDLILQTREIFAEIRKRMKKPVS